MWTPFEIDAKGGEMKKKWGHAHKGSMSFCHQWQRGILLMKLSFMLTWTWSGPMGCHWCHQIPPAVPWSLTEWVCALKHLLPIRMNLEATTLLKMLKTCWWFWRPWRWSWRPYRSWRIPRWVGEALMTHYVVIHALMVPWYPRRRPGNPTGNVMMALDS